MGRGWESSRKVLKMKKDGWNGWERGEDGWK